MLPGAPFRSTKECHHEISIAIEGAQRFLVPKSNLVIWVNLSDRLDVSPDRSVHRADENVDGAFTRAESLTAR